MNEPFPANPFLKKGPKFLTPPPKKITGGANGIGFAAVQIFAARGATVYILDLSPPDEALPPRTHFLQTNVASWAELLRAFKTAGRVDICVANAGVSEEANYFADSYDADTGELEEPKYRVIDVNYRAVINFVKISLSYLRRQGTGGSIVITTSATAYAPEHSLPVYSMSKLGVSGFFFFFPSLPPFSFSFYSLFRIRGLGKRKEKRKRKKRERANRK